MLPSRKEVIIYGRGGQGAVLMGKMLAYSIVLDGGYACSIPDFTFERRGAPVKSFLKIDREMIKERTHVYNPNCIIVLDPTIEASVNFYEGLRDGSIVIINKEEVTYEKVPLTIVKIGFVDATSIALKYLKLPIANTTMLGAFAKTTGWVSLESLEKSIRENLPEPLHDGNIRCLREGYEQTKVISRS